MVQKERKSGHWQVERLQFLKGEQRGLRLRYAVIDLQPCDLQRSPNFSNQTTTFLEKRPDMSLPTRGRVLARMVVIVVGAESVVFREGQMCYFCQKSGCLS